MKQKRTQLGLGTGAIFAIAIGVSVLFVGMWFMLSATSGSGSQQGAEESASYEGWSSYSSSALAASFKHPADWSVNPDPKTSCSNDVIFYIQPPKELQQQSIKGFSVTGSGAWQYSVAVLQKGKPSEDCVFKNETIKGAKFKYVRSFDKTQAGAFKDSYITFLSETDTGEPNVAILTGKEYTATRPMDDQALHKLKDKEFRVGMMIEPSDTAGVEALSFRPEEFKNTELYKQTKLILESFE